MILQKSKIYESRLFKNTEEKKFRDNYSENKDGCIIACLSYVCERNYKRMIKFFVKRGVLVLKYGMYSAAKGGHENLVYYFVSKGINKWFELDQGMYEAASEGHLNLIDFFILKGAGDWNYTLRSSVESDRKNLINFFICKGGEWSVPTKYWKLHKIKTEKSKKIIFKSE